MADTNLCNICPRNCNVNRNEKTGFCNESNTIRLARAALHFWEEPCISGETGSGTVFFSGCNLKCIFCQNKNIASGLIGKEVSIDRLCEIYYELESKGACNINLVTPTHFTNQIIESIDIVKSKGFKLPFVWNSSGYEIPNTIELLKNRIDIYLTDFKYLDSNLAKQYSNANNYPYYAKLALDKMIENAPNLVFENNLLKKGVIVRHLVLPGCIDDSLNIISYLFSKYGNKVIYSIMNQYTPPSNEVLKYKNLNRKLTSYEYDKVVKHCLKLGVDNAYIQIGETQKESYIPDFNYEGV